MIELPVRMTTQQAKGCLLVAEEIRAAESEVVQIDGSRLRFVDPFGLTLLAAACERVGQQGRRIEVVALNPDHGGYLRRMDLFKQPWISCCEEELSDAARFDGRASFVELRRLTSQAEVDGAANALASAVLGWVPGLREDAPLDEMTGYNEWFRAHEPLCHAFTELLQNALTHARRGGYGDANVWVTAQYLRRDDRIYIGIVDTGCGFLRPLEHHRELRSKTDEAAILLALRPRISCNREVGVFGDAANAGIGLTTTYRIVRAAAGKMLIVSGRGVVQVAGDAEASGSAIQIPRWQGAALGLELARTAMTKVNIRELMPPREIGRPAPNIRFE